MANAEQFRILTTGVKAWNQWRRSNWDVNPDLTGANLAGLELTVMYPEEWGEHTQQVYPLGADLRRADLSGADFASAHLQGADLSESDLTDANFNRAILWGVNFTGATLNNTEFGLAFFSGNNFGNLDLSVAKGLEIARHHGPSIIGVDTLYRSGGKIPESFLRGCGVPDDLITYLPSLLGANQSIQFYSCFISHSHKDEEFAKRLHSRLRTEHIRVWFAPEDLRGGEKLLEQIDHAIQVHDRLLIVLSENSMESDWVMSEIRNALKVEIKEKRRKLFPIRLVDFEVLRDWKCFDTDRGKDLAIGVREYFIPDFSNWKDHDAFETAFGKLLKALRAVEQL